MSEIKCNKLEITSLRQCDSIKSWGNIGPCIIEGPARQDSCQACQPPPQLLDLACHTHSDQPFKNCSLHWFLVFLSIYFILFWKCVPVCKRTGREEAKTRWIRCGREMQQHVLCAAAAASGAFFSPSRNYNTHFAPCFFFPHDVALKIPLLSTNARSSG